jgi:multimeric flavodoxin WrbA
LNEEGVDTEIFHIGNKPVRGCMACRKCKEGSHRCVYNDDTVNIGLDKTDEADGFIFGSPVYYASGNGAMIAFLDRMFYAGNNFAYKPGAAVVAARRAGTTAALDQLNKYFTISNMPVVPSQYWNMVHGHTPEDVRQDLEGLQIMRVLGRNMAWMLKCFEAGKKEGVSLPLMKEQRIMTNFIR